MDASTDSLFARSWHAHAWLALCVLAPFAQGQPAGVQHTPRVREVERTWHAELGEPAPDFDLGDTKGKTWRLSEHRGRVVVLEWYNPHCPVVAKAHARGGALSTLGNEGQQEGFVWVGINSGAPGMPGSGVKANEAGAWEMNLRYPVLLDETGWVGRMYGATNTPNLYIIDSRGRLVYTGGHEDQRGKNLVRDALRELEETGAIEVPRTKAFGCSVKYARRVEVGLVAPDFVLEGLDQREHRLSSLRGNYIVLEWFNPACPVVEEAYAPGGSLAGLASSMSARGVLWLAINSGAPGKPGTSAEEMRRAAETWGLAHPLLLDASGKVGKAYAARSTPEVFVIDRRGVIIYSGAPAPRDLGLNYVRQALEESWAGSPVSIPQTKSYGCSIKYDD
jgi:peroxiredoxin